jgi:hypothetical protein
VCSQPRYTLTNPSNFEPTVSKMPGSRAAALAGRRIDAEGADTPRFPLSQVETVRQRLHGLFVRQHISTIVCSAACGADLVALEEAGKLGVRRRVVLPFAKERFRQTSVVDRPGNWGEIYDHVIADVEARGDLVVLPSLASDEDDAYQAANEAIIGEAQTIAGSGERMAIIVWEGRARSNSDATEVFRIRAEEAGFSLAVILTL